MKILLLMPLSEQYTYLATAIYKKLSDEAKAHTFCMPMFMEYLIDTKISPNWTWALYDTLISAKNVYNTAAKENDNLIVIGNIDKSLKFDAIFNFQDNEEELDYSDNFINHLLKTDEIKSDPLLYKPISNLYDKTDSEMSMINCGATADFLSKYLTTDINIQLYELLTKEKQSDITK